MVTDVVYIDNKFAYYYFLSFSPILNIFRKFKIQKYSEHLSILDISFCTGSKPYLQKFVNPKEFSTLHGHSFLKLFCTDSLELFAKLFYTCLFLIYFVLKLKLFLLEKIHKKLTNQFVPGRSQGGGLTPSL